ncbi:muts domain V-domain-containing protein [Cristinia sonorae]|uniref:Muts domain V-domain-containing protein n=1 Tax=Cristinia sonorae TaxID=1940300 RepID=A0A8K0XPX4_9AGAR|nr:muts domain V-domain-containing protein [Cristinia sonorae]
MQVYSYRFPAKVRTNNTPLANEILANLARFPHCILLTRVGQFYESYFEQAADVARLLNIKLTTKSWGGGRVPMCGFPLIHLDKYLKVLVQQQKRFVAICEEFMRDPTLGPKGGFDRRVTRIVTPGTLIDEPFINPYENNYLLAVAQDVSDDRSVGLAWIDVSTGDFFTLQTPPDGLLDHLVRINPKEVVLERSRKESGHHLLQTLAEENFPMSYISTEVVTPANRVLEEKAGALSDLQQHPSPQSLTAVEVAAMQILTSFMREHLREHMPVLMAPRREDLMPRMQIDSHTIKALEIRETVAEGGTTGSLLSVIRKTVTTGGTRLLTRWLCSPSTSITEINSRQSLVAFFKSRPHLRADLVQSLYEVQDVTRVIQKFLLGRGDLDDLVSVQRTIGRWDAVRRRVDLEWDAELQERDIVNDQDWKCLHSLLSRLSDLHALAERIATVVVRRSNVSDNNISSDSETEVAATVSPYGAGEWSIRPQFSVTLEGLHETLNSLTLRRDKLEHELQAEYNAPSLTLRTSPQHGFFVHVGRAKRDCKKLKSNPSSFSLLTESASTCSFIFQEWSVLGANILNTTVAIQSAEREALGVLRNEVNAYSTELRRSSSVIDELDVALAFANVAEEHNFVRPIMRDDTSYQVKSGRHPTVELGLLGSGRVFTPNTVSLTSDGPIHVITGPNMAGKSTLLRQTALIAILAQTGSFVPAESAELGIVDRVFSRIGAKDDLFRDRSTFMVEMLETADILRRATPKSLVIMDEVGRGTTVVDGVAIAFATIHHLLTVNGCRVMFATHFHELSDMLGYSDEHKGSGAFERVKFYCTDIDEASDGYFAYSHRLRPGINRDSHGLKVAQLAGMPASAMQVASNAVSWFKQRSLSEGDRVQLRGLGDSLISK